MPGLLSFTLALQNQPYQKAVQASTAETNKLGESIREATKRMKEQYGVISVAPKPPPTPPDPAPEHHTQNVRHLRHELALVSEAAGAFGTELGGLGRLAGLAFDPMLMGIAAAVMALDMLKHAWQELHDQEVATLGRVFSQRNAMMEAVASATQDALTHNQAFALSLQHSADGMDLESQAMERRIAFFNATVEAQRSVISAQQAATDANIAADEALHNISPVEAARRRAGAEMSTRAQQNAAELSELQNEIREKERRLQEANTNAGPMAEAHAGMVNAAVPANAAVKSQEEAVRIAEQVRDERLKAKAEQDAYIDDLNAHRTLPNPQDLTYNPYTKQNDLALQAKAAQENLIAAQNHLAQAQRAAAPQNANIEAAKKRADIEQEIKNTYGQQISQAKLLLEVKKRQFAKEQEADKKAQEAKQKIAFAEAKAYMERRLEGVTSWEKMGLHFKTGGPTLWADHIKIVAAASAQTAYNTARMATALERLSAHNAPQTVGNAFAQLWMNRM